MKKKAIRETIEAIVIALVLALVIRTFVVQAFKIPSSSMEPTLLVGDHILVSKFSYGIQVPKPAMIKVFGLPVPFFSTEVKPWWGKIERGDVIVFRFPGDRSKDYIKRVIGVDGDVIEIIDKQVHINGKPFQDPYGIHLDPIIFPNGSGEPRDNFGPFTVPAGSVFVMGDNRDRSYDSRYWGVARMGEVKGKAFIIYWSWNPEDHWVRWERLGRVIR
ncbi:MAG: signal peptidase I [Deltaproteobacteria bacterium]|nr:signal peptidase I [Deltaproteobacteria bacterium]